MSVANLQGFVYTITNLSGGSLPGAVSQLTNSGSKHELRTVFRRHTGSCGQS